MICPRSLVLNGTFREFSDGFEELGIPRTGSAIPSPPPPPPFPRSLPLFDPALPFLSFALTLYLSRSGFRADSIKRLFAATKRRVRCFVRDASHFSSLTSLIPFSLPLIFSIFLRFSSSISSVFSIPPYYASLQVEIYKRERVFQGRTATVHPRMGTIWWIRFREGGSSTQWSKRRSRSNRGENPSARFCSTVC